VTAVQMSSRQVEHRREIRRERLRLGRLHEKRWRGASRGAGVFRSRSQGRGRGEGNSRAEDLERIKARMGKFALANAVAMRAKQLIEMRKSYWQPNGRGLLEQALLDIADGRARVVMSSLGAEPSAESTGVKPGEESSPKS